MKANITLSLDNEIINELRTIKDYSILVNEQLKAYFNARTSENKEILKQNLAIIKQNQRENNKKRREIEKRIEQIDLKYKKLKEMIRDKEMNCPECGKSMTILRDKARCKCGITIELKGGNN
jgi:ribosomal protein S27AE